MLNFASSIFPESKVILPESSKVIFVADMFIDDYVGGAELTSEALIESSPLEVYKLHSKDVSVDLLRAGHDKFWIFGNFAALDLNLIPTIVANMKYSILEYDYKYCKYRSPEKHLSAENSPCDCDTTPSGKFVSAFFQGSKSIWWMSEKQRNHYQSVFPFLAEKESTVLSSVFSEDVFSTVKILNDLSKDAVREKFIVIGSPSWIKGTDDAVEYCKSNNLDYEIVWNIAYSLMLEKLSKSKGLVFLPKGSDTCPRIVIEAKLLGCELHLNDNVQHKDEIWFSTPNILDTESYLYMARQRFWNGIKHDMTYVPKVSGYTTTYNCISQGYPFEESVKSLLGFCNQVVVVDGGSTDGTWEALEEMTKIDSRLQIKKQIRDWNDTRFAVFDGQQKAVARSLCTGDYCWQQDSDEIVHENDYVKINDLVRDFPNSLQLLSLPVIEYWGGPAKVRMDVFPWKWRLSKNHPHITHGIPGHLRRFDANGKMFAAQGTDGCDYIHKDTSEIIPNASFYTNDVDDTRMKGLHNEESRKKYENWFNTMTNGLPSVHHYSWFSISRKIRTYRDYWSKHWQSLYDMKQDDTAENNMFFQRPWSDVSEIDIEKLAVRLSMEMGGWVFHRPLSFNDFTPHIVSTQSHPSVMRNWLRARSVTPSNTDEIASKLKELIEVKSTDNWKIVRKPENNFDLVERNFPFGKRPVFVLRTDRKNYENLQQSRGLAISSDDSVDSFIERALFDMDALTESDRLRSREILTYLGGAPEIFGEIGFRQPRLQKYFSSLGSQKTIGWDVSDISLLFGKGLGYDVRKCDFDESVTDKINFDGCDLVICYHMLEHVSDPQRAIQRIYDGMKFGSIFHVEIPKEDFPNIQVAHVFPFHEGDLEYMLVAAGFEIVKSTTEAHRGAGNITRCIAVKK